FVVTKSGVQEGFGLVVVEAMGCGCPIIAGDLPAIHDTVVHKENGLLFESGNSQALADAIIRMLADPDLCAKLAGEGRRRVVQKFDWEIVAEKYAGEYKKIHSGMSLHEKEL
ncbi:MAG TPA: glycosyltransferase family 4 protein, partial [Smithella sp.]|nr:glycosyltransferase family 4 protein [Smithella sp.]